MSRTIIRLFTLAIVTVTLSGCVVVEDGTVGVSKSFGKINDKVLSPGIYPHVPVIREIEVWNTKTQRRALRLDMPSSEGLIVRLEASLLFRPVNVVELRTTVGVDFLRTVVDTTLRDTFREMLGKVRVEEVYKNPERLATAAMESMVGKMKERGIIVEDLLVTDLVLPVTFKEAIERKLNAEQKALEKEFELRQAKKDAEIAIAKAEGQARATEILSANLSAKYLQYLWIETLNENPNVIYVATESNMPLFRSVGSR